MVYNTLCWHLFWTSCGASEDSNTRYGSSRGDGDGDGDGIIAIAEDSNINGDEDMSSANNDGDEDMSSANNDGDGDGIAAVPRSDDGDGDNVITYYELLLLQSNYGTGKPSSRYANGGNLFYLSLFGNLILTIMFAFQHM